MIKYIQQLENRGQYYLPLIDIYESGEVNCKFKIPLIFYITYKDLFEEANAYISLFKRIDIENYFEKNTFDYDTYMSASSNFDEYNSINEVLDFIIQNYNRIDCDGKDIEEFISIVIRILSLLKDVYPHNREIYERSFKRFETAFNELQKFNSIIYNKDAVKHKKVFLPDSWFILSNGILYNTGNGHKGSNLIYDYTHINRIIEQSESMESKFKYYYNLTKEIEENGFTEKDFKVYTNLIYYPIYTDRTHEFPTCHERHILDHIIGIVMAKAYFYDFFENVQKYCLDPKKELERLKEMTNNELTDIFVRCCGFHKVASQLEKTITTSDVNYEETFKEYINNGWNIDFVSPIIIRRDLGIISELDMESPFVKRYVKQKN